MKALENSASIVGAVLVAIVMVVLGWFFGVSPRLSAASEAAAANQQQIVANIELNKTLDSRKEALKNLPHDEADLKDVHDALPLTEGLADWRRTLYAMVASTNVVLVQDGVADPVEISNTLTLADAATAVGKESYVEGLKFTGLIATPFSFEFAGSPSEVGAFLTQLQGDDHRFFLVSSLTATTFDGGSSVLGRTMSAGDQSISVSGYLFTLPENAASAPASAPAGAANPAPTPGATPSPSAAPAG